MEKGDPEIDAGELTKEEAEKYRGAVISHIRRGKGPRFSIVYAHIHAEDGTLLVAATLEYCVARMQAASLYYCDLK